MSISLKKGQKVSLSKDNPGLSRVVVGLGWERASLDGYQPTSHCMSSYSKNTHLLFHSS